MTLLKKARKNKEVNMGGFIAALGQQAAGQATGGAIAMGLQRIGANYDRKQMMKSQTQLQNLQIQGNEELMKYQQQLEQQNWENTNYSAQVGQMKKAGINPALLYGGGGGGGATMGSVSGGSVSSGQGLDPKTREATAPMGILNAAQIGLINAQADAAKSQAELNRSQIPNNPLTGENIKADTQNKLQNVNNLKAQEAQTKADTQIKNFEGWVKEQTMNDAIKQFHAQTNTAIEIAHQQMNQSKISDETKNAVIAKIKLNAINEGLDGILKRKDASIKEQQVRELQQKIRIMIENQDWNLQKITTDWQKEHGKEDNGVIEKLIQGIISTATAVIP